MGYTLIPNTSVNTKPNTALGISLQFTENGVFKPLYTDLEQAYSNLKNLLLTNRGERYYHPSFGCDLLSILFEPNVIELKIEINEIITDSILRFLPYIDINDIIIKTAEDDPAMTDTIHITILTSLNNINLNPVVIFIDENGLLSVN